jgi:hypothetical protein
MVHPEIMRMVADERLRSLRQDAKRLGRGAHEAVEGPRAERIELRLCTVADDCALERLAALNERPLPFGRLVVALVDGRLVAALPLAGGHVLTDPFVATSGLRRLLELRAAQLRAPRRRRWGLLHPLRAA